MISPDYDSMVAKVIAWGRDRPEALARLRCALRETTVLIEGGTTTKSFLLDVLSRPEVVSGEADTQWLDRVGAEMAEQPAQHADIALLSVAINVYDEEEALERASFLASARGGRPRATHVIGRSIELAYQGQTYTLVVSQIGPERYRVEVRGPGRRRRRGPAQRVPEPTGGGAEGVTRSASPPAPGATSWRWMASPTVSSATRRASSVPLLRRCVVAVPVSPGDVVEAGATVAVLESMKMETAVRAPQGGVVREVLAVVNSQVDAGAPLVRLDRASGETEEPEGPSVSFEEVVSPDADEAQSTAVLLLQNLNALLTGYDVTGKRGQALTEEYLRERTTLGDDQGELRDGEVALLTTFADVCDLSRNRPTDEEESADEQVHSPREHFHTYLRSLDVEQEDLPESFRVRLARALRHHGVTDLEPGARLEEAVYRVFLAQQRAADQVPVVAALLERWLDESEELTDPAREQVGEVIDRLVSATQLRYPTLGDLSRSIRFRLFEEPLIQQAREEAYRGIREHLDHLDEHPDADDRSEHIDAMVGLTEPVVRLLAARVVAGLRWCGAPARSAHPALLQGAHARGRRGLPAR